MKNVTQFLIVLILTSILCFLGCGEENECPAISLPTETVVVIPECSIDTLVFEYAYEALNDVGEGVRFWDVYMVAENPDFEVLEVRASKKVILNNGTILNAPIPIGFTDTIHYFYESATNCNEMQQASSSTIPLFDLPNVLYMSYGDCSFWATNGRKKIGTLAFDDTFLDFSEYAPSDVKFDLKFKTANYIPPYPSRYDEVCKSIRVELPITDIQNDYIPNFIARLQSFNEDPMRFSFSTEDILLLDVEVNIRDVDSEYTDYAAHLIQLNPAIHFNSVGGFIASDETIYSITPSYTLYECQMFEEIEKSRFRNIDLEQNRYALYFEVFNSKLVIKSNVILLR